MSYTRTTWADGATALSAEHMNNIEDGIEEAFSMAEGNSTMWSYIRNLVYPVGSIYMSATLSTVADVEAALGGTWVAWGSGRVPVGVDTSKAAFDTAEETGGSADAVVPYHNHTFTGDALAKHGHTFTGNALPTHNHTQNEHRHASDDNPSGVDAQRFLGLSKDDSLSYESGGGISGSGWTYPRITEDQDSGHFFKITYTGNTTATNKAASAGTPSGSISQVSAGTPSGSISYVGESGNVADANLQPYITCYMYKRTA